MEQLDKKNIPALCLRRIMKDISSLKKDSLPGIFVEHDEKDLTLVYALIIGPAGTPYDGGFFQFTVRFPDDYPSSPPQVKNITTGNGAVKFGPNLYEHGKVCISILNTVGKYSWTPVHSLSSVLLSIQSLLNEQPYGNKRGFDPMEDQESSNKYNDSVSHEVIRVAICGTLESTASIPDLFQEAMNKSFLDNYSKYENVAKEKISLDGKLLYNMGPHYVNESGVFNFSQLLERLRALRDKIKDEKKDDEPVAKHPKLETSAANDDSEADVSTDEDANVSGERNLRETEGAI